MKKLVIISLMLGIALGLIFADASAGMKEKKAVRVGIESNNNIGSQLPAAQNSTKPVAQKVTATPAQGVVLGTTDYDYGWNSGSRRDCVVDDAGTKVQMIFMERDLLAGAAPLNRRAIKWSNYDWATSTLTSAYPKARSVAASGFGAIDVFSGGPADGIAIVNGHTPNWFAMDAGPAAGNFTFTNIRPTGSTDPSLTINQTTQEIWWNDNDGGRTNTFVQKSADYGATWTVPGDSALIKAPHVMGNIDNKILVAPNGNLFMATCLTGGGSIAVVSPDSADCVGYFKSTDNGATWTWTTIARDGENVTYGTETVQNFFENFGSLDAVVDKNSNLHIAIEGYGAKTVYRTTDTVAQNFFGTLYWKTGQTGWKLISRPADAHVDDFDSASYVYNGNAIGHPYPALAVDPNGNGLFAIWSQTRIVGGHVDYALDGVCNYDLWYSFSNDLGTSWSTAQMLPNSDGGLFASAAPKLTKPDANTYRAHFVYLADTIAGSNVFGTDPAYAATVPHQVPYKYRVVDFSTTGVENAASLPTRFTLGQNYPNPFNPSTEIRYQIGKQSLVTLKVYNIMGQEVATLVNEVMSAGEHNVSFDASRLASGVYLYKLQAGSSVDTKKMMLVK
jgi:hypothetical protein